MANFKSKNLCDKVLKIKNLKWQFCCIFHWVCRCVPHFFCRCRFHGQICGTKSPVYRISKKVPKTLILWDKPCPLGCVSKFSFCLYLVVFFVGYIMVYSTFSVGAVFKEKFASQNCLFWQISTYFCPASEKHQKPRHGRGNG